MIVKIRLIYSKVRSEDKASDRASTSDATINTDAVDLAWSTYPNEIHLVLHSGREIVIAEDCEYDFLAERGR